MPRDSSRAEWLTAGSASRRACTTSQRRSSTSEVASDAAFGAGLAAALRLLSNGLAGLTAFFATCGGLL